jgi:hypothetical protein
MARQPHTEESIQHTDDEQDTGNHKVPNQPDSGGADRFGGTRKGAENLEHGTGGTSGTEGGVEQAGSTGQGRGSMERD